MTTTSTAELSFYIVSFGLCLDAFEVLAARSEYRRGLYSASIMGRVASRSGTACPIQQYPASLAIPVAVISSCICAVALPQARPVFVAMILVLHLTRLRYFPIGLAGFDQMITIVLVGVLLAFVFPGTPVAIAGLVFIAAQTCLAYFTSGFAKVVSASWRQGRAVTGILSTRAYGASGVGRLMSRHRYVGLLLDWTTIVFEMLFPAAVLAGGVVLLTWFAISVVFHATVALTMGLHMFIWTFGATYPAVLYLSWNLLGRQ